MALIRNIKNMPWIEAVVMASDHSVSLTAARRLGVSRKLHNAPAKKGINAYPSTTRNCPVRNRPYTNGFTIYRSPAK
jgi:biotin synthase-related radical SAM superfamily protein